MGRDPKSWIRRVVCLALMGGIGAPISAEVKIEEQVVGPLDGVVGFVVSAKGVHYAASTLQGSRSVLVVDGVESPKFDEPPPPPVFSADGAHYAYFGRQGTDYVVFVDGKEVARGPSKPTLAAGGDVLHLTPTGKRLFYMEETGNSLQHRYVVDGKPGPMSGPLRGYPVFSRDESRYAYAIQKAGPPPTNVMVVDGKELPYAGDNLSFTGDGKSVISVLKGKGKDSLMVDGKPLFSVPTVFSTPTGIEKYVAAPAGGLIATVVRKPPVGASVPLAVLYLNDKPVPGTESLQIPDVQFSPDGKRYVALCGTQNAAQFVVIDGKKGLEYGQIHDLAFTPDSSKVIYTAVSAMKNFVVVEDKESGPYNYLQGKTVVGGQGARIGFVATASEKFKNVVVVEGTTLPAYFQSGVFGDALSFSPDGSRYAFYKKTDMMNGSVRLMVDGVEMPASSAAGFNSEINPNVGEGFLFSPDGKYIAFLGNDGKGTGGVWVNDRLISKVTAASAIRPVFTPDSQHLIWTLMSRDHAVFVDGVEVMRYGLSDLDRSAGAWGVGPDGVYQFLAPSDKVVKRYRLIPAPETGLAKLLGK